MVAGTPCMCMRTTGTPRSAHRGSSAGSRGPAETSVTTSAPWSRARRAIAAFEVSPEIGTRTAVRTARSTGRSRRRSSSAGTGAAPGRRDSAPTSRMAAPWATISAAAAAARSGSRCRPGSEKESGVAFRMPTSAVRSRTRAPERVRSAGGPRSAAGRTGGLSGRGGRRVPEATVHASELAQDLVLLLAEGHRAELVAHAPLAHHLARQLGGALDVVARPGGHAAEGQLLRRPPAEEDGELAEEMVLRVGVPVVERDLLRQAECH